MSRIAIVAASSLLGEGVKAAVAAEAGWHALAPVRHVDDVDGPVDAVVAVASDASEAASLHRALARRVPLVLLGTQGGLTGVEAPAAGHRPPEPPPRGGLQRGSQAGRSAGHRASSVTSCATCSRRYSPAAKPVRNSCWSPRLEGARGSSVLS